MRQIIEIVKAIKGKKYIIASWCIIIINGLLPEWIWAYCARLIHCDITGYVQYAISEAKAYAAIAIAEEGMRQKAIEAFKFAVDGYFIIGGTDYSASRLNEFIKKLDS